MLGTDKTTKTEKHDSRRNAKYCHKEEDALLSEKTVECVESVRVPMIETTLHPVVSACCQGKILQQPQTR